MKLLRAHWLLLCRLAPVLGVSLGGVAIEAALAQQNVSGGIRHSQLRGVSSSVIFSTVNRNDARAALKVWFDIVARERGFLLDSTVDILDSVTEIRERLRSHSVELVTMGAVDYLDLESGNLVVPVLTDARSSQGGALYSYVLLVNSSSGATSIASLQGKNLLVASRDGANTGIVWLDVFLGQQKLGRAASFFASVKAPAKAQACILPVFFGAVDACVVDEVSLNLAKEMNPQLGRLRVLARSRPMIESVIAVPAEPHPYQKELIDSMLSLHEDPRGRQLLMVFKTNRLVRIQPGDLDSARELWRDYNRLSGSAPSRPLGPGPATAAERDQADRGKERY
ncbi:MAG: phosphate/phosphite/phosphonate ABC transporter substrate-binding protein [Bryobacteraceae bacterium]|jgi:phosphonate transport system substrate-binding protein